LLPAAPARRGGRAAPAAPAAPPPGSTELQWNPSAGAQSFAGGLVVRAEGGFVLEMRKALVADPRSLVRPACTK
jgi:hypothetical protein